MLDAKIVVSTSGYIYMFTGGDISWRSTKHTLVAEFIAYFEASNH